MPKGKRTGQTSALRTQKKKKRSGRRNERAPVRKRNPYTGLIVTGIRTLASALPAGRAITAFVDMVFSSLGITSESVAVTDDTLEANEVAIFGLGGIVFLNYVNVIARAPNVARNVTKSIRTWIDTPFSDGKLMNLSVTIQPDNPTAARSGKWAMAFVPIRNIADFETLSKDYVPMSVAKLEALPGAVSTNADRPMTLSFRPSPEDGFINQFNPLSNIFGAVIVSYGEDIRANYTEFGAADFAPNLTVKGTVKLRQPVLSGGTSGFEDSTWHPTKFPRLHLISESKPGTSYVFGSDGFKCTKGAARCNVSGKVYSPPTNANLSLSRLSMSDMAF